MAHRSALTVSTNRHVCLLLLTCTLLTVLPIRDNTAIANSKSNRLEPKTEEVTFTNKQGVLAGTLYLPREKSCPAVVLITGSNRGPRGPLLLRIAEHFAQHGVAVLHYDSPGTGKSTGNTMLQSRDDRAAEAISAIRYLRTQQGIDRDHVGLFGGSEGASIVLLAAALHPLEVSFVIPVSGGVGVGGGSVLEQMNHAAECFAVMRNLTLEEQQKIITFEQLGYVFLSGLNILEWKLIEKRVEQWTDEPWAEYIRICRKRTQKTPITELEKQDIKNTFGSVMEVYMQAKWSKLWPFQKEWLRQMIRMDVNQFFAFLEIPRMAQDWDWDLRHYEEKVACPVLAILGEDDRWVPPNLIATRLRQYLVEVKNPDFEVIVIPGANHVLTTTGPDMDMNQSLREFVPGYLDKMTSWIKAHSTSSSSPDSPGAM
jgi:pimeloyl-ACP methyl ester carboxylesterase